MAQFTNQAQLSYGNVVLSSNVAVGEIVSLLTVTKTAVRQEYSQGSDVTYIINIVNAGNAAVKNLTVADDLGAYAFGAGTLTPLEYIDGTVLYFVNGALQPTPTATVGDGLNIEGISVPANGNALIVYEATVNQYAPIGTDGAITNTATVTGDCANAMASETITAVSAPILSITKSVSPIPAGRL